MVIRLFSMLLAATTALLSAAPARAVPLPVTLAITDGEHAFSEALDGNLTPSGRVRSINGTTMPTWSVSWDITARDEGGALPANGLNAQVNIGNLTDSIQQYTLIVDRTLVFAIRGGSTVGGSLAMDVYTPGGALFDPEDDGSPFFTVTIDGTVFFEHTLAGPATGIGVGWTFPPDPPGGNGAPHDGPSDIDSFSLRFAFELAPRTDAQIRVGLGASQTVPEPSGAVALVFGLGILLSRRHWLLRLRRNSLSQSYRLLRCK